MKNSCENLPEEYENDGNTYCNGVVNCKYYEGECTFMDMGSGNPDDMPCRVREQETIQAFRKWREERKEVLDDVPLNNTVDTLSKELEVYKKALNRAVEDMDDLGIDVYSQIACDDEEETKLLDSLIKTCGWVEGWKQYYLEKARNEDEKT